MAKGNLFQGMARGKVGDVVFSRANGEQISRVRNRHPKNPRTNAQLFQRAIMATIVQAYSAGKEIFDHAFQGYAVGAQNQREFIKRNAKLLRDIIAADINTPIATNQQKGRVVAPGVTSPVPFTYVISNGTYDQTLFTLEGGQYSLPKANADEKVDEYVSRNNILAGDIYTFIIFAARKDIKYQSPSWDDVLASQNACDFGYLRLTVKKDVSENSSVLSNYSQLFEVEVGGNNVSIPNLSNVLINDVVTIEIIFDAEVYTGTGAIGLIRSRKDQDLRSNSVMNMIYGDDAENMFGIASEYLLDAWKAGTSSIGDSDLILEGGEG